MKNVVKILTKLDTLVASLSLTVIVILTLIGVIMRYAVGRPLAWLEEIQIFLFVYTIFFGGSIAFRTGNQVSIDLIANHLKPGARRILDIVDYIISMAILIYLLFGGIGLMQSVSGKVTPYFKISYVYIDLAAPIGIVLMMIQYTMIMIQSLRGGTEAKEEVAGQ